MKETSSKYSFTVRWQPFLLRPDTPLEGREKPANTSDNPRVNSRLRAAGQSVGIDFTGKTDRAPNTIRAHSVLTLADELEQAGKVPAGTQDRLAEVFFRNNFTDGVFLGDDSALISAASEVGIDEAAVRAVLNDSSAQAAVRKADNKWKSQGVHGVPYFFFNGHPAFSGAQDAATFVDVFRKVSKM